jgi:hypothetical protein
MPVQVHSCTDQLHGALQMAQELWDAWRGEWLELVVMVCAEFPRDNDVTLRLACED